jgi:hypothetical protein
MLHAPPECGDDIIGIIERRKELAGNMAANGYWLAGIVIVCHRAHRGCRSRVRWRATHGKPPFSQ